MTKNLITPFVFSLLLTASNFSYGQNNKITNNDLTSFKSDSIKLRNLIINILKWHQKDTSVDFEPMTNKSTDSVYSGIDWKKHNQRILALKKTNFFSQIFFDNYTKIAQHLDEELKQNKTKYFVGDLPPYDHPNEWCNCQDYPNNIWNNFKITSLKISDNQATFKWTFDKKNLYSVKARREDNIWKVTDLEGFQIKNFSW